jgi:hypothetical protein
MAIHTLTDGERYKIGKVNNTAVILESTDEAGSAYTLRPTQFICETSASVKINLQGSNNSGVPVLWLNNTFNGTNSDCFIRFDSLVGAPTWVAGFDSSTESFVIDKSSAVNALAPSFIISGSTENVGLGTNNPTSKLHVVGTGNITGNTTIGGTLGVAGTTTLTGTKPITIEPSSGFMKIKGVSGGWTAGSTFLGNSNAALGGFTILGNNNSLTRFIIGTWSTDEKMVILANGNVGIGTIAPGTAFDVKGSVQIDQYAAGTTVPNTAGYLRLISSAKTGWGPGDELGKIEFYSLDTSGVGVRNAASIRAVNSQGDGTSTTTFNGELAFYTSAHNATESEAVRINSAGNVGIGDSTPSYQLELSTNSAGKPTSNTWTVTSDERIKENIQLADLDRCYDIVKNLPLKHYKWREDVYSTKQIEDRHALGWIAQDVKSVFPKAVNSREFKYNKKYEDTVIPAVFDENGIEIEKERTSSKLISEDIIKDCLDLDSGQIIASLYGAVQKLIAKVEALENK